MIAQYVKIDMLKFRARCQNKTFETCKYFSSYQKNSVFKIILRTTDRKRADQPKVSMRFEKEKLMQISCVFGALRTEKVHRIYDYSGQNVQKLLDFQVSIADKTMERLSNHNPEK